MTEEESTCCVKPAMNTALPPAARVRVGPFDVVASRYGVQCQGCDELALTLFDVLDYMEEVPVVAQYKLADGTVTDRFPTGKTLDDAQPVVVKLPAGTAISPPCASTRTCRKLPAAMWNIWKRPLAARSSISPLARSAMPASFVTDLHKMVSRNAA